MDGFLFDDYHSSSNEIVDYIIHFNKFLMLEINFIIENHAEGGIIRN